MNDDFPAEWFPIIIMLIFFLGAKSRISRLEAIYVLSQKKGNYELAFTRYTTDSGYTSDSEFTTDSGKRQSDLF